MGINFTRRHFRFDSERFGFVTAPGSNEKIACFIPNVSLGGAYLRFDDKVFLANIRTGDLLRLDVPDFGELHVRIVRSDRKGAGVEFCDDDGVRTTVDRVLHSIVGHLKSIVQVWMQQTA